jgi:hypothetical protein
MQREIKKDHKRVAGFYTLLLIIAVSHGTLFKSSPDFERGVIFHKFLVFFVIFKGFSDCHGELQRILPKGDCLQSSLSGAHGQIREKILPTGLQL